MGLTPFPPQQATIARLPLRSTSSIGNLLSKNLSLVVLTLIS